MKFTYRFSSVLMCVLVCMQIISCSPKFKKYKIDTSVFYEDKRSSTVDLMKGKHVIGFFNPDCVHCKKAALAMHEIRLKHPGTPFFMFVYCVNSNAIDSAALNDFWKESQAQDVPHACLDAKEYVNNTSGAFPQILWVNDGWVERNTSNNAVDEKEVMNWLE